MNQLDAHEYARQLLDRYGSNAVVLAAQKACSCERTGQANRASDWRQIEAALKVTQGPHQS